MNTIRKILKLRYQLVAIIESFVQILRRKRADQYGYIYLANPNEVVNLELGMTITEINRATGGVRFSGQYTSAAEHAETNQRMYAEIERQLSKERK